MRFPNAANGVKKLFTAEILSLVSGICLVAGMAFALVTAAGASVYNQEASDAAAFTALGGGVGFIVCVIAAGVLALIAFILNLLGIFKSSKDDSAFKIALYALFAGIILSAVSLTFSGINPVVSSLTDSLHTVTTLLVTIYVIQGIRNLATRLNNADMDNKGNNLFKMMIAIVLLVFASKIVVMIFGGVIWTSVPAAVMSLIAAILSVVQYVLYLSYLSKAKKMLAQAK